MKIVFIISILLLVACSQKKSQKGANTDITPWTIAEPQIANKKGKIFLTNIQHQGKEPLQLTDSLIFDSNENNNNMNFTTLTRCYDADQNELIETKTFSFQSEIKIQKLMPKESFHPKYLFQKQTLNCTFKFTVKKEDGSSHNFRLYSQSVNLSEQVEDNLITIAGNHQTDIPILDHKNLHQEYFVLDDIETDNLELLCQSFRAKFLVQKNLLSPFYGFNVKSIKNKVYPREFCRIIGERNGEYILSKPFQIEFETLNLNLKINSMKDRYTYNNPNVNVAEIVIENASNHHIKTEINFPNQIMINKIGTIYSSVLKISYQDTKKILKNDNYSYSVSLNGGEQTSFYLITDLTRKCFTKVGMALGETVINDLNADVYFLPESVHLKLQKHPNFYYLKSQTNSNYLAVNVVNDDVDHPMYAQLKGENKVYETYSPETTNGCLSTPPQIINPPENINPF